ncbi:MAG: Smr/MutS family protein [Pikeienuella sp.]
MLKPEGRPLLAQVTAEHRAHHPTPVGRPEPGLDRRTAERLRRGERTPDARIDLHGMTAARAHARLDGFIRQSIAARHRCVLVITGKGGRKESGEDAPFMTPRGGILRDAAPRWLRSGPHARQIVGIYEAHQRHGGGGAFYVYLKKKT